MSTRDGYTGRPFTLILCGGGDSRMSDLRQRLRTLVRQCPHGVLVTTRDVPGGFACSADRSDTGVLLLQPCSADRVPTGPVRWIGALRTDAEVDAACGWIAAGAWERGRFLSDPSA